MSYDPNFLGGGCSTQQFPSEAWYTEISSPTISTMVFDFGRINFPHSPNYSIGVTGTQNYIANKLNILNVGTTPPSNAGTT